MNFFDEYNKFVQEIKRFIEEEDYVNAALLLEDGLTKDPKIIVLPRFYFSVYIKLNRFEEARSWLMKAIVKYEESSQTDALYYKGLYYFLGDELKYSMESLRQCFMEDIYYLKKLLNDMSFGLLRETKEFKELIAPTQVFEVNEFISLKLIFSKTLIYLCGDLFLTCQKVALSLSPNEFETYKDFDNIDDIIDFYSSQTSSEEVISITPEEEFWAHCSNMQAWVENNYDSSILSRYISFPILIELSNRGISRFKTILKEEIIYRIKKGGINMLRWFIEANSENYLVCFTEEDLFDGLLSLGEAEIMRNITRFIPLEYTLTTSLRGSRYYPSLRDENKMHFCVENNNITELEILMDDMSYSEQYRSALLQVKSLKHLEELAIYSSENINKTGVKVFLKALHNFDNLHREL